MERTGEHFFLTMKPVGTLTHADYEHINPIIDTALAGVKSPSINVFLDASELDGWELRAAWDDMKLGLKHGSEFKKVAIAGNKKWLELSARLGNWFMSGEIQFFDDTHEALTWLEED
jgi:hypothetical protein